jgi:hypothetical protein
VVRAPGVTEQPALDVESPPLVLPLSSALLVVGGMAAPEASSPVPDPDVGMPNES